MYFGGGFFFPRTRFLSSGQGVTRRFCRPCPDWPFPRCLQKNLAMLVLPFEQVGRRPIFRLFFQLWKQLHFRRKLHSSSHPFLFDQVLDSCTDGSAWDSLDGWMEESDNDQFLRFAV